MTTTRKILWTVRVAFVLRILSSSDSRIRDSICNRLRYLPSNTGDPFLDTSPRIPHSDTLLRQYVTNNTRTHYLLISTRSEIHNTLSSMDYYQLSFIGFVALNTGLAYKEYRTDQTTLRSVGDAAEAGEKIDHAAIKHFEKNFYLVYYITVAADWMQGLHIYALYKYEKGLPKTTVAALYASGFISGAISASFVGSLADKHGRRAACMVNCLTYSMCCLTLLSNDFTILLFDRITGGISTTLLFSVFETWMVADYHSRGTEMAGMDLGNVFGQMTTFSSIVAILGGVIDDLLVQATGSRTTPFIASVCCLCIAAIFLSTRWRENYGESKTSASTQSTTDTLSILRNPQMLALALTAYVFEGTMLE
jgi:MFS transporter, MFS domain-containing protein family, molybdate-anion transporter